MTKLPHEILELPKDATKSEIKSAYRKLSLLNHPDKNNRSEESTKKFIEIRAAYESMMENLDKPLDAEDQSNQDSNEDETPYWKSYFASNEFKKFKSNFFSFTLEVYNLLEDGEFFTAKARTDYVAVRDCKSLDQIGIKDSSNIKESLGEKSIKLYTMMAEVLKLLEPELDQVLQYSGTSLTKITEESEIDTNLNIKNAINVYGDVYVTISAEQAKTITRVKTVMNLLSRPPIEALETNKAFLTRIEEVYIPLGLNNVHLELNELYDQVINVRLHNSKALEGESLIAAIRGAVASQDLDKFIIISELIYEGSIHINVGRPVSFNVFEEVLSEAKRSKIDEGKLLIMVQFLLEQRNFTPDEYSIKTTANGGFYIVAQYLIDHNSPSKALSEWDLFDFHGTHDQFESFKWLKDHGIKINPTIVRQTICHDKLQFKVEALKNPGNIELAKDFFVRENMANLEQIEAIELDCNNFALFTNGWNKNEKVIEAISSGEIGNVQRLLDYGAKAEYAILTSLYKASPEILELMLSKFESVRMHHSSDNSLLLARTISSKSVDNVKTLFAKGMPVYTNTHLILQNTTPEIAQIVLDQMRSQNPKEGTSSIETCTHHVYNDHNSYDHYKESWYNFYCKKFSYNLDTPENCEVSKLVADYLGQTDKVDWSTCE